MAAIRTRFRIGMVVILILSCLGPAVLVAEVTVFAAGSDNTILRLQEGAWVSMEAQLTTQPTTEDLSAVWACPGGEVFAAGDGGTMLHFDGSVWELMETGTTEDFTVLWGSGDSMIVAATSGGSIYHYEGTSWALAFSAPVTINEIFGFSSGDIYACGPGSHIFHYDGSAWSTAVAGGSLAIDFDIILPWTPDDIDIFGEYVPGDWELATCWGFHYDGASWTEVEYPQFADFGFLWVWDGTRVDSTTMMISGDFPFKYEKDGTITMISCMEGNGINTFLAYDKWVSPLGGTYCAGSSEIAFLLETSPWCEVSTYGGDESLYSIHGTSDSDIWAVGGGGTVVHYNGFDWEMEFGPFEGCDYTAVWGSGPSDFWFAGCMDKVLRYDGIRFHTTNVSIPDHLRRVVDVHGTSSANVCLAVRGSGAAGIYGQVEVYDGISFTGLPTLSFEIFNRVGAHPDGPVLAAGEIFNSLERWYEERLYRYNSSWSDISFHFDYAQDYYGDFWSDGEDLFHLGADANYMGSIFNYVLKVDTTGSPVKASDQLDTWYYGIWGVSAEDIWVCGNAGRVRRVLSGSADEIMDTGVAQTLRSIWGSCAEDVYAVGDGGVIVHYDGDSWSQMTSGTTSDLLGIWGCDDAVTDAEVPTPGASLRIGTIHPNPFNPVTEIEYSIPARGRVEMKVYDISGRLVAVLADGVMDAGAYRTSWDGRNRKGRTVSSGVYFCRLTVDGQSTAKKLVLAR